MAYGFTIMIWQRILEIDLMTHLLFLGGLVALVCMALLGVNNRTKQLTSSDSSRQMIGLYYQLESGVNLFICKASRDKVRLIANVIKAIVKRSAEATDVVDIDAFQQVCGEAFNPAKLHTKLISSTTSVYPRYHNRGIIVSGSNTQN